jgi:hypothetical protein
MTDAERLADLLVTLERQGTTVMDLIHAGQPVEPWRLYPGDEGIFDRRTHCQLYYHAHDDQRDEDGHFHTVRLFHDHTVHLVAISMARDGWPRALFTVNYWATGDVWKPAKLLKAYAARFRIDETRGPAPVVRFVNLMFRVFLAEIEQLQDDKMAALIAHRLSHPEGDAFQDRALEILSWRDIDLRHRVAETMVARA